MRSFVNDITGLKLTKFRTKLWRIYINLNNAIQRERLGKDKPTIRVCIRKISRSFATAPKTNFESYFLVKRVPGRGLEWRESGKTVLYLLIIILLISFIIIKLLIKLITILAKTGNGTPNFENYVETN
jgi:hypothetical protein